MKFIVPKGWAASRRRRTPVHPRRRSVALSAVVAAILTSLAAALPPAAATAPATALNEPAASQLSAEDRAVMMEQAPYMELDEQVRRTAPAQASSPLAGTRVNRANQTLNVYWVGAAPADLTSIQKSTAQEFTPVEEMT